MGSTFATGVNFGPERPILTEVERIVHYRDLAVQLRQWAETETNEETRLGLLDMARQYERLVSQRVPTKN